jgi:hypothetical protein
MQSTDPRYNAIKQRAIAELRENALSLTGYDTLQEACEQRGLMGLRNGIAGALLYACEELAPDVIQSAETDLPVRANRADRFSKGNHDQAEREITKILVAECPTRKAALQEQAARWRKLERRQKAQLRRLERGDRLRGSRP